HAMWLGLYERRFQARFASALAPGAAVWDVGAHAGLYSLLAARLGARVVAFEPLERNRTWLGRHLHANGVEDRVTVRPVALGIRAGSAAWRDEASGLEGRVEEGEGPVVVAPADA